MNINFIGRWRIWFALSAAVVAVAVGSLVLNGLNFGIEFRGGTVMELRGEKAVTAEQVRNVLAGFDEEVAGSAIIQPTQDNGVIVRTQRLVPEQQQGASAALTEELNLERQSVQSVGPAWGQQITRAAVIALILSIGALLIYISLRFEFKMAISAVVALVHDVLIAIGIYALVGREVTPATVAALLTILGYSLYDTIVVFHRIVENSSKLVKMTYSEMANTSVNQVLMRSINTSITTLLPVTSILLLGGETLKDFAFALFVGIASAAYSSIFTASPLLALWKEREPKYVALRRRIQKAMA